MVDNTRQLLAKLTLSTKEAKTGVAEIKRQLQELQKESKAAHDAKVKQTQKELDLQNKLRDQAAELLSDTQLQIKALQDKLKYGKQDQTVRQGIIKEEKNLLAIQEAQLKVIQLQPRFAKVALDDLYKKIALEKAELALVESKMRIGAGVTKASITSTATAAIQANPAALAQAENRLNQLQGTYASQQVRSSMAAAEAEIAANAKAFKLGEIQAKEYEERQLAILAEVHSKRLNLIESESNAQTMRVRQLESLGVKTKEEANLEVRIIEEKNKQIAISEKRRYEQQMASVHGNIAQVQTRGHLVTSGLQQKSAALVFRDESQTIQAEMSEVRRAHALGEMAHKDYIVKMTALNAQAHAVRIRQINSERDVMLNAIKEEQKLGKISADQAVLRNKIAMQEIDIRTKAEITAMKKAQAQLTELSPGERFERSFLARLMHFSSLFLGQGLSVQMMGAVAAGNVLEKVLERIGEKLREVLVQGGREPQLYEQFVKLSKRQGEDPTEFLEKMHRATRGLVDDADMYKVANNFMQQGVTATSEKIAELTKYTVGLSRAQGHTAPDAMQSLIRASLTGRTMMLGYALGIDQAQLRLRGLPATIDPVIRKNKEFEHTLEVLKHRYEAIGEPALSFTEILQQQKLAGKNFLDEMAKGMASSSAFHNFLQGATVGISKLTEKAGEQGAKIGKYLGDSFVIVGPVIDVAKASLQAFWSVLESIAEIVRITWHTFTDWTKVLGGSWRTGVVGAIEQLTTFKGLVATIAQVLTIVAGTVTNVASGFTLLKNVLKSLDEGNLSGAKKAIQDFNNDLKKTEEETYRKVAELQLWKEGRLPSTVPTPGAAASGQPNPPDPGLQMQLAKLDLQIKKATEKEKLELTLERIKLETDANRQAYDDSEVSIQQYLDKQRILNGQEHAAKLSDIKLETKAKIDEIGVEQSLGKMDAGVAGKQRRLVEIQGRLQEEKEVIAFNQKQAQLNREMLQDMRQARLKYLEEVSKIDEAAIKEREKNIENEFKQGKIGANDYITYRKQLINDELQNTLAGLDLKKTAEKDNQVALAQISAERIQAQIKAEQELTDLQRQQEDYRLQSIRQHNDQVKGILESRLQLATNAGDTSAQSAILNSLQTQTLNYLHQQQLELEVLDNDADRYSSQWFEVQKNIDSAGEELNKLHETGLQNIETGHGRVSGLLQSQMSLSQAANTGGQQAILVNLQAENQKYIEQLQYQLTLQDAGSKQWYDIQTKIYGAYENQVKLNEELLKAKDILTPIANIFGTLGKAFGYNKDFGSAMQRVSGNLQTMSQSRASGTINGRPATPYSLGQSLVGLFRPGSSEVQGTGHTERELRKYGYSKAQIASMKREAATTASKARSPEEQKFYDALLRSGDDVKVFGTSIAKYIDPFNSSLVRLRSNTIDAATALVKFTSTLTGATLHGDKTSTTAEMPERPVSSIPTLPPTAQPKELPQETGGGVSGLSSSGIDVPTSSSWTGGGFKNIMSNLLGLGDASKKTTDSVGSMPDKLTKFGTGLTGVIGQVGGAISSIFGAKSGGEGALGGIMSGASLGSAGGPIGMAIGAAAGGILGGLAGSKAADFQHKMDLINSQLDSIRRGVQDGNTTIGSAIGQTTALRSSALSTLSGTGGKKDDKKGRTEAARAAVASINQELATLLQQQKQFIDQMHEQIDMFSNPQPFQQYLSSLVEIENEYKNFVSAASGNAEEMANARKWLVMALQNYDVTLQQQQLQNQTQAIQNAIQLNDLLQQRNVMEQQYSLQVWNIENQGVLTRTYSGAQTKASQLAQLKQQHDIQEQNMNEQIAVAQDRYNQEKLIFNLATTRVQLEAQLLQAQEAQTTYDMQRITALNQVVNALNTLNANGGLANMSNVQSVFSNLGLNAPADLSQYGMPNISQPRYMPPVYQGMSFVGQSGGWDIYLGSRGYKAVGPDGKFYNMTDVGAAMPGASQAEWGNIPVTYHASGGDYTAGAPIGVGEQGPEILVPNTSGTVLSNQIITKIQQMTNQQPNMAGANIQLDAHTQMYGLATQRASIEQAIAKAQQSTITADMNRIAQLRGLLTDLKSAKGGAAVTSSDLETMLSNLYSIRGRYGVGGFYKETL